MRTLIVPCAGSKEVDGRPIFLNTHPCGELLAIKTILGVFPESYDRIVYTVLRETEEKFNASEMIMQANDGRYPTEVLVLDEKTGGPAETVYRTIKNAGIVGEFAVRDSHAYIKLDEFPNGNFIACLDLTKYEKPIDKLREKSFIVLNEQGQALDVIEKHFVSDVISVGLYGFKSTEDFLLAYEHLDDPNYPIKKLFVSHIISYLIGYKQRVFHSVPTARYEEWTTGAAWQRVQKNYADCFLDLDSIVDENFKINEKLMKDMKKLSRAGVSFIGFTSGKDDHGITDLLKNNGIKVNTVVCNCSYSKIKVLAKTESVISEMALEI